MQQMFLESQSSPSMDRLVEATTVNITVWGIFMAI
jgi:uncharacterized protein affecting Mg2+/Co2+ transport